MQIQQEWMIDIGEKRCRWPPVWMLCRIKWRWQTPYELDGWIANKCESEWISIKTFDDNKNTQSKWIWNMFPTNNESKTYILSKSAMTKMMKSWLNAVNRTSMRWWTGCDVLESDENNTKHWIFTMTINRAWDWAVDVTDVDSNCPKGLYLSYSLRVRLSDKQNAMETHQTNRKQTRWSLIFGGARRRRRSVESVCDGVPAGYHNPTTMVLLKMLDRCESCERWGFCWDADWEYFDVFAVNKAIENEQNRDAVQTEDKS